MEVTVGGIISQSFAMVKERLGPLIGTWAVYFAIQIGLMFVLTFAVGASFGMVRDLENPAAAGGGIFFLIVAFYLGYLLIYCAQFGSLNALGSPLQRLDFGAAFAVGLRSALPLLGVILVLLIAYMIAAFPIGMVVGLFAAAGRAGALLGALIALVILIFVGSRLSIVFPTIAVEGVRNPFTAIGRSWSLTRGKVLPVFLAMLVFAVIAIALIGIVFIPVAGSLASLSGGDAGPAPAPAAAMGSMAFMMVGLIVVGVFLTIFSAVMQSVIHAQLSGSTGEDLAETFA